MTCEERQRTSTNKEAIPQPLTHGSLFSGIGGF